MILQSNYRADFFKYITRTFGQSPPGAALCQKNERYFYARSKTRREGAGRRVLVCRRGGREVVRGAIPAHVTDTERVCLVLMNERWNFSTRF